MQLLQPEPWVKVLARPQIHHLTQMGRMMGGVAKTFKHGTNGYRNHKCRCEVCKAANSAAAAKYYAENKQKLAAQHAAYRAANKQKLAANRAAWWAANPNYQAEYRAANPDKVAAAGHRRRARKANNGIYEVTDRDIARLKQRHHYECFYCGGHHRDSPLTIDHIIPIHQGGRHAIGNLIPACRSCNSSKHASLLVAWKHRG